MKDTSDRASSVLRLGFIPQTDCAPVAVAHELGLFGEYGLDVRLKRVPAGSTARDLLATGDLDAAHASGALAFDLRGEREDDERGVIVPLMLGAHGSAITLSTRIPPGEVSKFGIKQFLARRPRQKRKFTLAAPGRFSCHYLLLQDWAARNELVPGEDFEIVLLPSFIMARHLAFGHIDGYCAPEPWNSESILAKHGWCAATSVDLAPGHPDKALLVKKSFAASHADDCTRLGAALLHACRICQDPSFVPELVRILTRSGYVGRAAPLLHNGLDPRFDTGKGRIPLADFHRFHGGDLNHPTPGKAEWFLTRMQRAGLVADPPHPSLLQLFRPDLFKASQDLLMPT